MLPPLAALLVVLAAPAEGPTAEKIAAGIDEATRLERARELDRARAQLQRLIALPGDALDSELHDQLQLRRCALFSLENRAADARACYETAHPALRTPDAKALLRYRVASIDLAAGHLEEALAEMAQLIVDAPQTNGAWRGAILVRGVRRRIGGAAGEADALLGLSSRLLLHRSSGDRRMVAGLLVESGRVRLRDCNVPDRALPVLYQARKYAVGTVWEDDATYWLAQAWQATGDTGWAIATYQELIDARTTSWFVGSYDSRYYDNALYELARLFEQEGEVEEAIDTYDELVDEAPNSLYADDAAFASARLQAAQGDLDPLRDFIEDFPKSSLVPDARRLLERR